MTFVYPAIFHKEDGSYWVEFPDLEGCHTYGDTVAETAKAAQEALQGFLLTLIDDGKDFPAPSDIVEIKVSDGFATLVTCSLDQYKDTRAVKKTLSIPAWLNERAVARGVNFSQVLQDALVAKLEE